MPSTADEVGVNRALRVLGVVDDQPCSALAAKTLDFN